MAKTKKARIAWGLVALLSALLLGGVGLLVVRMGPYWEVLYALRTKRHRHPLETVTFCSAGRR
jgi:hypothetical protein